MTSPSNGDPLQQPENPPSIPVLDVRKTRTLARDESPETSTTSLPIRTSSPSALGSRTSTLSSVLSRSSSPNGRLSLSFARFGRSQVNSPLGNSSETYDDTRSLIIRAFSPTVAIYAAPEVDELATGKGIKDGFTGLIRPFGNRVSGKVVVRDSSGASRAWEDFGVHFADLGRLVEDGTSSADAEHLEKVEELMEQFIGEGFDDTADVPARGEVSHFYKLFLSRLLCSTTMSPHESFRHPVGAVIAISSSTKQPIETLRSLYQQTAQGSRALPPYANPEYLRYYVLVHDEDRDDFSKSSALFDQMKRHFGLHCHLLRLRSTPCTQSDDDSEELPVCEWLSPAEQLSILRETAQLIDLNIPTSPYIFSSDASALRTFVRELIAQSIIYHMEQRIALWNEQIASRRRGISGRFMSLSKRWTGIGSSSRNSSSATNLGGSGASGNYDSLQGTYRYDVPESLLRKLADYAFMLRDYKLAASTYELLRSDYANDKAWKHLAGANEMCCISTLLNPLTSSGSTKFKVENFDQMLETASYSYLTRCSDPALALRALLLGVELLKVRGRTATELAAKWGIRSLELGLVGSIGHVLVSERVASCFADRTGLGNTSWGTRKRKAALWNVMAADDWMKLGRAEVAAEKLDEAQELYNETKNSQSIKQYHELAEYLEQLRLAVRMKLGEARKRGFSGATRQLELDGAIEGQEEVEDETVEEMNALENADSRINRRSLLGVAGGAVVGPLEPTPLSPVRLNRRDPLSQGDDDFE
ncbi:ER-golgi trafficking TRAPP I complex 85 kDa subunit-domain-containing protein [Exophiala viscosa]|uniref:ER-golgi trafficking TRAPP I complex 85 kDa subunit-domain-containing protein n=1 Tax=Exophiala viscosa TaxID=2486360 RepID=UPI00219DA2C2|nr:ER-golgi trafficking TRAPP I complex 85 kDa subunit-domain-containing protein [Exophiala viscosa]